MCAPKGPYDADPNPLDDTISHKPTTLLISNPTIRQRKLTLISRHQSALQKDRGVNKIAPTSVDPPRTLDASYAISHTLQNLNIGIACIKVANNDRIDNQRAADYAIFVGGRHTQLHAATDKSTKKINKTTLEWEFQ